MVSSFGGTPMYVYPKNLSATANTINWSSLSSNASNVTLTLSKAGIQAQTATKGLTIFQKTLDKMKNI